MLWTTLATANRISSTASRILLAKPYWGRRAGRMELQPWEAPYLEYFRVLMKTVIWKERLWENDKNGEMMWA